MDACPRYLCTCHCARKKAPVNLLMCTFELYMFIGVSMQLRELSKVSSDPILLVGCTWKKKEASMNIIKISMNIINFLHRVKLRHNDANWCSYACAGVRPLFFFFFFFQVQPYNRK